MAAKVVHLGRHGRLFARERAFLSILPRHPNLVRLLAATTTPDNEYGILYLGAYGRIPLSTVLAAAPLPEVLAVKLFVEIASALAALHRCCLVHRDIKASNVLWDPIKEHATLIDFGLAKEAEHGLLTSNSGGSPVYMAPEARFLSFLLGVSRSAPFLLLLVSSPR